MVQGQALSFIQNLYYPGSTNLYQILPGLLRQDA